MDKKIDFEEDPVEFRVSTDIYNPAYYAKEDESTSWYENTFMTIAITILTPIAFVCGYIVRRWKK